NRTLRDKRGTERRSAAVGTRRALRKDSSADDSNHRPTRQYTAAGLPAWRDIVADTAESLAGLILGVDLDGVCADFYGKMREVVAEWFECPIEELTPDVSYGLKEWGVTDTDEYMSIHRFAVTRRGLFSDVPLIPGARKYLRLLSNE